MIPRLVVVVGLCASVFAVAACGNPQPATPPSAPGDYPYILEEGLASGMSAGQEAVLRSALAEGRRVTFEEYKAAKQDEMDCIAGLGVDIANVRQVDHVGWTEILYGFAVTGEDDTDQLHAAVEDCRNTNGQWVDLAYQYSATQEERDALFERYRAPMTACLEGRGISVPQDATRQDVQELDAQQHLGPGQRLCDEESGYGVAQ